MINTTLSSPLYEYSNVICSYWNQLNNTFSKEITDKNENYIHSKKKKITQNNKASPPQKKRTDFKSRVNMKTCAYKYVLSRPFNICSDTYFMAAGWSTYHRTNHPMIWDNDSLAIQYRNKNLKHIFFEGLIFSIFLYRGLLPK